MPEKMTKDEAAAMACRIARLEPTGPTGAKLIACMDAYAFALVADRDAEIAKLRSERDADRPDGMQVCWSRDDDDDGTAGSELIVHDFQQQNRVAVRFGADRNLMSVLWIKNGVPGHKKMAPTDADEIARLNRLLIHSIKGSSELPEATI